jgi:hypothetical protein
MSQQPHPDFVSALMRVKTSLMIDSNASEEYTRLLWSDLVKYWFLNNDVVIQSIDEYRENHKYKQYPKIGDLVPLMKKRLFPGPEDAYKESCQNIGNKNHNWSHDVVRATANGVGHHNLKMGKKGSEEAFMNRYHDNIKLYVSGRRFSFPDELPAPESNSDMDTIRHWCQNHGADLATNSHHLWYLTKTGHVAKMAYDRALKQMREKQWWKDFTERTGAEPLLPLPRAINR